MKLARATFAVAALAAPALTQSVVDPAAFEWLDTTTSTGFPLGLPTRDIVRYQEVHDGLAGSARTITGIAIRRIDSSGTVPAFTADMAMELSTAPTTAATMSDQFALNRGGDLVAALPRRIVSFPETELPIEGLPPFDLVVPCDVPFVFGGSGPLCVEFIVHSHTNATPMAFALAQEDPTPRTAEVMVGCGNFALTTSIANEVVTHTATGPNGGSTVFFAFGFEREPQPLDLTIAGGPGCFWEIEVAAAVATIADYFTGAQVEIDIAGVDPGTLYFCQALSAPVFFGDVTPARTLFASDTHMVTAGIARAAGRVWSEDLTDTAGQLQPILGLVLEVR